MTQSVGKSHSPHFTILFLSEDTKRENGDL